LSCRLNGCARGSNKNCVSFRRNQKNPLSRGGLRKKDQVGIEL
jgi:hypothetical protein